MKVYNHELLYEILEMQVRDNQPTPRLVAMLQTMVDKYAQRPNWIDYPYKEDMKQEAMMVLCNHVHKFDMMKSDNPFAYCTSIIHSCFIQVISRERKQRMIQDSISLEDVEEIDPFGADNG